MEAHEEAIEPKMRDFGKQNIDDKVIEVDPYATMVTTKVFSHDDEERLFHSQNVGRRKSFAFYC